MYRPEHFVFRPTLTSVSIMMSCRSSPGAGLGCRGQFDSVQRSQARLGLDTVTTTVGIRRRETSASRRARTPFATPHNKDGGCVTHRRQRTARRALSGVQYRQLTKVRPKYSKQPRGVRDLNRGHPRLVGVGCQLVPGVQI